jgi:ribose/xylose/arabinose/galactoside ABC-type transport system permease subunit
VYAVGSNPEAARLAGVPVAVVTTAVYVISGVLNNGGNLLAINAFYLQIAIGALVLVAVGFDQMNTRKSARG